MLVATANMTGCGKASSKPKDAPDRLREKFEQSLVRKSDGKPYFEEA